MLGQMELNKIIFALLGGVVLLVVGGFFLGSFEEKSSAVEFEKAFNGACTQLRLVHNCDLSKMGDIKVQYQPAGQLVNYSLIELCNQRLGKGSVDSAIADTAACARACGCY